MNIHEYQAKELLKTRGIPVLKGEVVVTAEEAVAAAKRLPGSVYVVKAQIHAGGRGKGGGVKVVNSIAEVGEVTRKMLGMQLITHQTGKQGQQVRRVYIEDGCDIDRELYLGILIDRATSRVTVMASTEGGIDIEEVAKNSSEKIIRVTVDPAVGFQPFQGRQIAFGLGLEGKQIGKAGELIGNMYTAFLDLDASIVEINPLVVTKEGDIIPLDAKMNFDDNAMFRQKEVESLRDTEEEDPTERRANDNELSYVKLSGNIGCMVNGAGLAMATMDIIKLHGGDPANFL
ncbi:MAG: ADP-forming succinate--CoA ligase subunit beta, partial [Alphaproteobacteria bacterium]|nr:ADP-forming succinate--CoA ligase subunit beta [Alphaproteobacteria bacterium]